MKARKFVNLMAVGLALTLVGTGCKHAPVGVTHIPRNNREGQIGDLHNGNPIDTTANNFKTSDVTSTSPQPDPALLSNYARNAEMFKSDTVHFDYDSSAIKSGEESKISHVADYLKSNPSNAVEVQGNCDERGTDEYNRALGERRALAIREALISQGVDGGKVTTVSFGRDKPIDLGHSEAAHARNRRGDFVLLTPP